jgi:hypothetical protein
LPALPQATLFSRVQGAGQQSDGTASGADALRSNQTGFSETGSNKLYISSLPGVPLIYGEFNAPAANNKLGIATTTVAAGEAIKVGNGASLTVGGLWTNSSSRALKQKIQALSTQDASNALAALSPVRYVYSDSPDKVYVGFIAEDVPELVASIDCKSLSPTDIVAVLTAVTKEQQQTMDTQRSEIVQQRAEIIALRNALSLQESAIQKQEDCLLQIEMALAEVMREQPRNLEVGFIN